MSSAWLLPEHIADVLPAQARRIEELRRDLLDGARAYGFELVMPPLLEHLDSLLSGTGREQLDTVSSAANRSFIVSTGVLLESRCGGANFSEWPQQRLAWQIVGRARVKARGSAAAGEPVC